VAPLVESGRIKARAANLARVLRNREGERTEALRVHVYRQARRVTPLLGVEAEGLRYIVSTREASGVSYSTFVNGGRYEAGLMDRLLDELRKRGHMDSLQGRTVLELGANIGTETVAMLARYGAARVIAVEPDAENARLLRANLALNDVADRAHVLQLAVSDADGTVVLERSEENWGDHRVRVADPQGTAVIGEDVRATVEVTSRTVDALAAEGVLDLAAVDLVWMDVQGHEGHVLAGAQRLADARIPVLTEYWPYGLERAGGLDRFHDLVAARYADVVDLRADTQDPPETLPAARVAELAARYSPQDSTARYVAHGDLLLLP